MAAMRGEPLTMERTRAWKSMGVSFSKGEMRRRAASHRRGSRRRGASFELRRRGCSARKKPRTGIERRRGGDLYLRGNDRDRRRRERHRGGVVVAAVLQRWDRVRRALGPALHLEEGARGTAALALRHSALAHVLLRRAELAQHGAHRGSERRRGRDDRERHVHAREAYPASEHARGPAHDAHGYVVSAAERSSKHPPGTIAQRREVCARRERAPLR